MQKIKSFVRSRSGFAIVSNLLTLLISVFLFRPFWEESDDVGIALIAEGAFGSHEPHLVYSNILYGKVLCFMSEVIPAIRWHAVFSYLFMFTASTVFVYLIARDKKGRMLSVFLLATAFYEAYVALQFSKVATYIAILAFMLLFELARCDIAKKMKRFMVPLAMLCALYAFVLRIESFLLAAMIAGCYGICLVVDEYRKGVLSGKIRTYLAYFAPVFILAAILFAADRYSYSNGQWKEYWEYYDSVTGMVDYHNEALLYEQHEDELKNFGGSENDALLYITYGSLEKDITTLSLMDNISALEPKGAGYVNSDLIKAWIANIYDELFSMNSAVTGFFLLMGLLSACIFQSEDKRLLVSNVIIQTALSVAILFYYQYSSRWCHRVVFALLLAQLVLIVYMLSTVRIPDPGTPLIHCAIILLVASVIYLRLGNEFSYREYERAGYDYDELVSYMEQNKDRLFVADTFTMLEYDKYDIFGAARPGQFDNFLQTDSVLMANSPLNIAIGKKYGYEDPFDALSARDKKVILVDALSPDTELTFCNEHGDGGEYRLEKSGDAGGIDMYNIL